MVQCVYAKTEAIMYRVTTRNSYLSKVICYISERVITVRSRYYATPAAATSDCNFLHTASSPRDGRDATRACT